MPKVGGGALKKMRTKKRKHDEEEMQIGEEDANDLSRKKKWRRDKVGTRLRDGDKKPGSERGTPKKTKTERRKSHANGSNNENAEPVVEKKSKSANSSLKNAFTSSPIATTSGSLTK